MLDRVLTVCRIALALAGAFAFASVGYVVLSARQLVTHADGVLTRAQGVESKLNATAINLDNATKVWADSSKNQATAINLLAMDAHATLSQARTAISSTQDAVAVISAQAAHMGPLLDSAKAAFDTVPPAVKSIQAESDASTQTIRDIDTRVTDPHVTALMAHLDSITGSGAETAKSMAAISKDAQVKLHKFLNPDFKKLTFWGGADATVQWLHSRIEPSLF